MNKKAKIALLLASHVLASAAGVAFGIAAYENLVLRNSHVTVDTVLRYATYASLQRSFASDKEYKEALLGFLGVLEKYKDDTNFIVTERTIAIDKMTSYERLARISKREGDLKMAEHYMNNALTACNGTQWRPCSEERIRFISMRLEENSVSDLLNGSKSRK